MPTKKLIDFLDQNDIRYVIINHSSAYTASEIAANAHVKGQELAKTVMVKIDGEMNLLVLPAKYKVNFDLLKKHTGSSEIELAGGIIINEREYLVVEIVRPGIVFGVDKKLLTSSSNVDKFREEYNLFLEGNRELINQESKEDSFSLGTDGVLLQINPHQNSVKGG